MRKQMFSRDSPRFTYFNPSLDPSVTSHAHTQLHVRLFVPLHMCRTGSETDMFKKMNVQSLLLSLVTRVWWTWLCVQNKSDYSFAACNKEKPDNTDTVL